jgi:hypothetical protein
VRKTRHEKVEEVEDLMRWGSPPDQIARALRVTPASVARAMHREGRHDLAQPFDRLAWSRRKAAA